MGSGAFLVEACRQVATKLVDAWDVHGGPPAIPPDEDELLHARRLIAQRCLYGVDKNPMAVDLARLSLWLATLAKDHEFTFVDHALQHGDSLVGLSRQQIEAFHLDADQPRFQAGFETMSVREHVAKVAELRRHIREADESASDSELRDLWDQAQAEIDKVRLFGDLVLAAYFEGESPNERERKRSEYGSAVMNGEADQYRARLEEWRHAEQPLAPFHWEIEFPEVFDRENPGFDAIVGNPPFLGGTKLEPMFGKSWRSFVVLFVARGETGTRGAGDLAAYFIRRAFDLARKSGTAGLVTTNSICQGDTRQIGLAQLVAQGGQIFGANTTVRWPGISSTEISQVWFAKGRVDPPFILDGKEVVEITSSLGLSIPERMPDALASNQNLAFEGAKLIGSGFILEQGEALNLIGTEDPCGNVVRPFLSGSDINSRPDCSASRWAINFWDWPLSRDDASSKSRVHCADEFPACLEIVKERVRPSRLAKPPDSAWNKAIRERWWQYGLWRPALYAPIKGMNRVLVRSRVSNTHAVVFYSTTVIFSDATVVFSCDSWAAFASIQSSVHELWMRRFASTMRNDIRYTPSSCFQTFPFSEGWQSDPKLGSMGQNFYEFRAALMVNNDEGLTKTYNRFHDPDERDPQIVKLRDLNAAMDRAVLEAYGWSDIPTDCEFLLDYEIDEEEWGNKKKPLRYRWPDEVRDEVLARLMALNSERAREEQLSGGDAQLLLEPAEVQI
jgi:hypothetical protein